MELVFSSLLPSTIDSCDNDWVLSHISFRMFNSFIERLFKSGLFITEHRFSVDQFAFGLKSSAKQVADVKNAM